MCVDWRKQAALLCAAFFALFAMGPIRAGAESPSWNGKYMLVGYADQKTGNSRAAKQPEALFSGEMTFVTQCSGGSCVATVVDGPRPKNPTVPLPERYTWDGGRWANVYDWQWDCFVADGVPKVWAPARSWTYYIPQPDGTLRGTWMTEIYGGPCEGSVWMPVAAFPLQRQ